MVESPVPPAAPTPGRSFRRRLGVIVGATPMVGSLLVMIALAVLWVRTAAPDGSKDAKLEYGQSCYASLADRSSYKTAEWSELAVISGRGQVALLTKHVNRNAYLKNPPAVDPALTARRWSRTRPADYELGWLLMPGAPLGTLRATTEGGGVGLTGDEVTERNLVVPTWLVMLLGIGPVVWWLWCPPGRAFPRLTLRRLGCLVGGAAVAAAFVVALARSAVVGRMTGGYLVQPFKPANAHDPAFAGLQADGLELSVGTDENLAMILAKLPGGQKLRCVRCFGSGITDRGLALLADRPDLVELDLRYSKDFTDAGIGRLASLRNLRALYLSDTRITDAALATVGRFDQLRTLNLDGTAVTDAGLRHLGHLKRLEDLSMASVRGVTDAGMAGLAGCDRLCNLWYDSMESTGAGFQTLGRTIPCFTLRGVEQAALHGDEPAAAAALVARDGRQVRAFMALAAAAARAGDYLVGEPRAADPDDDSARAIRALYSYKRRWPMFGTDPGSKNHPLPIRGDEVRVGRLRLVRDGGRWRIDVRDLDESVVADALAVAAPLAEAVKRIAPSFGPGVYDYKDAAEQRKFRADLAAAARAAGWQAPAPAEPPAAAPGP